jgi:hypothetical protein
MQMTQNESAIEQINLGYNEQEDRLLLKLGLVDKTEIAVWVTRRVCKLMWGLLQNASGNLLPPAPQEATPKTVAPSHKDQVIENFAREVAEQKSIENMDFKSEYLTDRQTRTDEPMLAIQCAIITYEEDLPSGKPKPPALALECTNGQTVKMALSNELIHAVTNMMQLATREAGWDLLMTADKTQVGLNPIQQVLH